MRYASKKRNKINRDAKPIREALRAEVGRCEVCGKTSGRFDVHEIARGANRWKALDKRFAILLLCRVCHQRIHVENWSEARQLAVLRRSRPDDFSLFGYLKITNENAMRRITMDEVLANIQSEGTR